MAKRSRCDEPDSSGSEGAKRRRSPRLESAQYAANMDASSLVDGHLRSPVGAVIHDQSFSEQRPSSFDASTATTHGVIDGKQVAAAAPAHSLLESVPPRTDHDAASDAEAEHPEEPSSQPGFGIVKHEPEDIAGPSEKSPAASQVQPYATVPGGSEGQPTPLRPDNHDEQPRHPPGDPIAHWVETSSWPIGFAQAAAMLQNTAPNNVNTKKRPCDGTELSTAEKESLEERRLIDQALVRNGVFRNDAGQVTAESKELCKAFLSGKHPVSGSPFSEEGFRSLLDQIQNRNEARLQRDITPWVVPSAESLNLLGNMSHAFIGEEINADWSYCHLSLGSTKPKPDYMAGLKITAFTDKEHQKLLNYCAPQRPYRVTPHVAFPFLLCEVKTEENGLGRADRQNIHSASIAVKAIITLYQTAFGVSDPERVRELNGRLLVFSVSHDCDRVLMYGHYAVIKPNVLDDPQFYRHNIACVSLTAQDYKDLAVPFNFVRSVYEDFAPQHVQRIREAVAVFSEPTRTASEPPKVAELATESSETLLEDAFTEFVDGSGGSSSPNKRRITPMYKEYLNKLSDMMRQMNEQKKESEEQLEKQRQQAEEQARLQRQQAEQQRQDFKEQLENQKAQAEQQMQMLLGQMAEQRRLAEQQLAEQKRQSEQQVEQMRDIISLLKAQNAPTTMAHPPATVSASG
ncbi:hypothetical protein ANO11243_002520 [Dothideomycetidae sp. 11243]|nr:hypothetical protein ANO11243_002520 [fungal sp. No.11243]